MQMATINIDFIYVILAQVVTFYVFLLRFAKAEFARKSKVIVDEIVKINDSCIEFYVKYMDYLRVEYLESEKPDKELIKLTQELHTLKRKIDNHLSIFDNITLNYPFGSAINYIFPYGWYEKTYKSLAKFQPIVNYDWFKKCEPSKYQFEQLKSLYVSSITDDTILERDRTLDRDWYKHRTSMRDRENLNYLDDMASSVLDEIIDSGMDFIIFLEDKNKSVYR